MTDNKLTMFFITGILLVLQGWVLYMSYGMWKFTWKYSKVWGAAFIAFGVAMILALLRRIILLWYLIGWDGFLGILVNWADHVGIPIIHTSCWIVFLILLRRWWKIFFDKYMKDAHWADTLVEREKSMDVREKAVSKREVAVKKKEKKK